jgi:hypothetical protein
MQALFLAIVFPALSAFTVSFRLVDLSIFGWNSSVGFPTSKTNIAPVED